MTVLNATPKRARVENEDDSMIESLSIIVESTPEDLAREASLNESVRAAVRAATKGAAAACASTSLRICSWSRTRSSSSILVAKGLLNSVMSAG